MVKRKAQVLSILYLLLMVWACTPDNSNTSDTDYRDNFTGTWNFTETISSKKSNKASETSSYLVVISKDPSNSTQVILKNFGNSGTSSTIYGGVTIGQIMINEQTTSDNWKIKGTGSYIPSGRMNWNYVITAGGDATSYTAAAIKQ